jgi:hypothetical protein
MTMNKYRQQVCDSTAKAASLAMPADRVQVEQTPAYIYTGLVNNPILGAPIPYTSLGLGTVRAPGKSHQVALIGIQPKGRATSSGFDNFDGDYTLGARYQYSTNFGDNLPGNHRVLVGYDTKDLTDFAIDSRHLLEEIIGLVPIAEKSSNRPRF